MLLLQMRKEYFACKLFIVIPILLSAILIQTTWTATSQPPIVGMPSHQMGGVSIPQLAPTAAMFAIPTSQNQPNPSLSMTTMAPSRINIGNSSRFTAATTTSTTPLVTTPSHRPAISSSTPPTAIFDVLHSSTTTTTTSRPITPTSSAVTIVSTPEITSTTMISTTTPPTTPSTTILATTMETTLAPNLQDEFAPAFSTLGPESPPVPQSPVQSTPRPHNSNVELPNLDSELQPNIPNLQRQNFDESTQHIPTNINNNNNNNDFVMEPRDNPFDSFGPPSTTVAPPPSVTTETTAISTTTTTSSPLPPQNSPLPDVTNSSLPTSAPSTPTTASNDQSNNQFMSSNQLNVSNITINNQVPSDFKRLPDNRSRAENSNSPFSIINGNSSTAAKVQILRPNQKQKFKCLNQTDCRNGYCISGTCFCSPGFTGEACDINIDECRQFGGQPCMNNGSCIDDINGFRCDCPAGFRGERCQDLADMCSDSPCLNNAKCINHRTHFTCKCEPGWEGQHCEIDIDDCAKNPCQNNATCHDQVNSYRCDCLSGFMGYNCETNINDCALSPCQNNATCHDLINDYECECPIGFAGKNCDENIDDCANKPCLHGECVDYPGDYECKCLDGWMGKNCDEDINECETTNGRPVCLNGGTCQNLQPSFHCLCPLGYGAHRQLDNQLLSQSCWRADNCRCRSSSRKCGEITDYCKAKQPCGKHGTCKNLNSIKGQYQCECQSDYLGTRCEIKRDCFNQCHNHHAHCVNNVTCACLPGKREERTMCEYVSSCQQVEGDLCLNGGFCKNLETGGYQCTCLEPFYGPICQFVAEKPQFDAFLFVVITCVGLLVAACAVVSLVLFRSVRKARATRGTYSPSTQEKHGNSASELLKLPIPERLI